jgi:hypothetical protein
MVKITKLIFFMVFINIYIQFQILIRNLKLQIRIRQKFRIRTDLDTQHWSCGTVQRWRFAFALLPLHEEQGVNAIPALNESIVVFWWCDLDVNNSVPVRR